MRLSEESGERSTTSSQWTRESHRSLQWLRIVLICVLQPLFYGAATRVPLVYIGVHARMVYDFPWWKVGLLIATYQGSRASINAVVPSLGTVNSHVGGVVLGMIGYALQGTFPNRLDVFWWSLVLIGHSEVIICMQNYVKHEFSTFSILSLRENLRLQYACNVAGTAIGFIGAAASYRYGGILRVTGFGLFLELMELVSIAAYVVLVHYVPSSKLTHDFVDIKKKVYIDLDSMIPLKDEISATSNGLESGNGNRQDYLLEESIENSAGKSLQSHRPPWISYLVVITFGVQALMIGVILSTAPIALNQVYNIDLLVVGLIFGAGEFVGSIVLFILVPFHHQITARKLLRDPINLLVVVGGVGLLSLLFCRNSTILAVSSTILIMALNDIGTSLTAELQGSSVHIEYYTYINSWANSVRRIGNTMTAACGPILYGITFWLPFVAFGTITVTWVLFMYFAFSIRANQVMEALGGLTGKRDSDDVRGMAFYSNKLSYVTAEIAMQAIGEESNIRGVNNKSYPERQNSL